MKTGLVLEGGGMRGIYTAGVLDVFLENGIGFDGVIGVSAGAIHGMSYVSGQKGRSLRYYKKYCHDPRFMSFRSLLRTGDFVGAQFCYHDLPEKLDLYDYEAFQQTPTKFYVTCTNVETGQPEYILLTDMRTQMDYVRASASLPYFSRIVRLQDKKYLDGGYSDSIPVQAFSAMGYHKNVIILTREPGYVKKGEHTKLASLCYHKYPAFVKTVRNRPQMYNETLQTIDQLEKEQKAFVIRPDTPLNIGRLENNPQKIQELYNRGIQDGNQILPRLMEFLSQ